MKNLKIRDLTLRDGQQSQFATRMRQEQVDRVLPYYAKANFYAMEVWGGAVPDSVMRYLGENPWNRLETIKKGVGNVSKLTALTRGRNLFGYAPYPEEVIEGFLKTALKSGLDILRIFDALNDIDNMKSSIKFARRYGGTADCAVCYTVDPKFSSTDKFKAFLSGKKLPKGIFNVEYFVNKAKDLEKAGAHIITIKDMAGLLYPRVAAELIKALKQEVSLPIDLHTHDTPGYGLASIVMAILNGVDIVDTVITPFASGPAAPAFEIVQIFCNKLGIETGVNLEEVQNINNELFSIREELADFDTTKMIPRRFNILKDKLPEEIELYFNKAIEAAKENRYEELVECCQAINRWFNFPEPNENVRHAEIPGGMYTNMIAQLKGLKLDHLMDKVLKMVPKVRVDAGCPPLVTPTSQIVGSQAVNSVVSLEKDQDMYSNTTVQFKNLVKGQYGKTPFPVDPDFREEICGSREEIPYDTSGYQKQENPVLVNYGNVKTAQNKKEELLLELFPAVAKTYLESLRQLEHERFTSAEETERKKAITPKDLTNSMIDNLYDDDWY